MKIISIANAKKKKNGLRILPSARLFVVVKWHHGSERVNILLCRCVCVDFSTRIFLQATAVQGLTSSGPGTRLQLHGSSLNSVLKSRNQPQVSFPFVRLDVNRTAVAYHS